MRNPWNSMPFFQFSHFLTLREPTKGRKIKAADVTLRFFSGAFSSAQILTRPLILPSCLKKHQKINIDNLTLLPLGPTNYTTYVAPLMYFMRPKSPTNIPHKMRPKTQVLFTPNLKEFQFRHFSLKKISGFTIESTISELRNSEKQTSEISELRNWNLRSCLVKPISEFRDRSSKIVYSVKGLKLLVFSISQISTKIAHFAYNLHTYFVQILSDVRTNDENGSSKQTENETVFHGGCA